MDDTQNNTQTQAVPAKIIPGRNGGSLRPYDSARAREMQARSVQSRLNRAMRAAQDRTAARLAATDNTITHWTDAWGEMVADQAEALREAAANGKPRGDSLEKVGQALGAVPRAADAQAQPAPVTNILAISDTAAAALAQALARIQPQVLDAHAEETEETGG